MDYNDMKVVELKALARERGLRGYSRLRRAKLVALLQNNSPPALRSPPRPTRGPGPTFRRGLHPNLRLRLGLDSLVHKKWIYSNNKK